MQRSGGRDRQHRPGNLQLVKVVQTPREIQSRIFDRLGVVTFIGHSHLCKSFALTRTEVFEVVAPKFIIRPDHKYIVSVGSVGQPRDYDNRASYTIYDSGEQTFEFKRVPYDIDMAAQKIFDSDLEPNFGNRLFLGV